VIIPRSSQAAPVGTPVHVGTGVTSRLHIQTHDVVFWCSRFSRVYRVEGRPVSQMGWSKRHGVAIRFGRERRSSGSIEIIRTPGHEGALSHAPEGTGVMTGSYQVVPPEAPIHIRTLRRPVDQCNGSCDYGSHVSIFSMAMEVIS